MRVQERQTTKFVLLCRSSEYAAVKESFEEKYKRQQAVVKPLQPSSLIEALARAAAAADAESDHVYDNFLQVLLRLLRVFPLPLLFTAVLSCLGLEWCLTAS